MAKHSSPTSVNWVPAALVALVVLLLVVGGIGAFQLLDRGAGGGPTVAGEGDAADAAAPSAGREDDASGQTAAGAGQSADASPGEADWAGSGGRCNTGLW